MSYDLFFRPRSGEVTPQAFFDYFRARPHYKVEGGQAWYQNQDSGVYFVFEHIADDRDGEPGHPFSLNINFYRPSYFVLEAESEVTALVAHFDFLVSDPQSNGMGVGKYVAELLVSGWHHGNEFGYSAILGDKEKRPEVFSLPTRRLHEVWRWNLGRETLQKRVGESQFVPRILFLHLDGVAATAAVWPDAIQTVLPKVDYLFVGREQLAPRSLFGKKKDTVFVPWSKAAPLIEKYDSRKHDGAFDLNYSDCPQELAGFVRGLSRSTPPANTGLPADQVLDRELVEKYTT